ncbi:hypothetical protein CANCADRAFT_24048 [Tortispora caseinolytica NRRL Y-17796]|uniref:ATP synthase subunit delta, mitochondrial n=1 Tax=Tortispora caseinolytica NRRL Y-17796 TaxID=767744 RepID=A0A1E4TF72_9ASCO|nr:hypothetical protein CANCADRAFT_24048 [Tortispora caseinolytica NRRL Y-17796]
MKSLRLSQNAVRIARRGYAEGASDKLRLNFALPTEALYKNVEVTQVNIPASLGDMGILANHAPSVEQLKPGVVDIIGNDGTSKQYFVAGGFAIMQPDATLSINAVEAFDIEDFDASAVRSKLAEAEKVASGSGTEQEIAEAKIELEVLEALSAILK